MLLQDGLPIAYASRRLTETEHRYAQIEKELLAVVFGLSRVDQYTYGRCVEVQSDHKPLESIVRKKESAQHTKTSPEDVPGFAALSV